MPCINVSIDFKLCRLYSLKIFVKKLTESLLKEPFLFVNSLPPRLLCSCGAWAVLCWPTCSVVCQCLKLPKGLVLPAACLFPAQDESALVMTIPRWWSRGLAFWDGRESVLPEDKLQMTYLVKGSEFYICLVSLIIVRSDVICSKSKIPYVRQGSVWNMYIKS